MKQAVSHFMWSVPPLKDPLRRGSRKIAYNVPKLPKQYKISEEWTITLSTVDCSIGSAINIVSHTGIPGT